MGHALAGIVGVDENIVVAGIAADEGGIVNGVEHMAGPAMRNAETSDQIARPTETDVFARVVVSRR